MLFVGTALFAGTSGVKCEGSVVDQYGEGIVGIMVTTTSGPSVSVTTDSLGRFSMSGIQAGSTDKIIVPVGFSAGGNTENEPLTQPENVVNFTLHDDSYGSLSVVSSSFFHFSQFSWLVNSHLAF